MAFLKRILTSIGSNLLIFYQDNPVRVTAIAISAIVAIASALGLAVAPQSIEGVLKIIIPVLLAGEISRRKVTPV